MGEFSFIIKPSIIFVLPNLSNSRYLLVELDGSADMDPGMDIATGGGYRSKKAQICRVNSDCPVGKACIAGLCVLAGHKARGPDCSNWPCRAISRPLCGSDGKTYPNKCVLKQTATCKDGKQDLVIASKGKCSGARSKLGKSKTLENKEQNTIRLRTLVDNDSGSCQKCDKKQQKQNTDALLECIGDVFEQQPKDYLECFKKIAILDTNADDENRKCNPCSCEKLRSFGIKKVLENPKIMDIFCLSDGSPDMDPGMDVTAEGPEMPPEEELIDDLEPETLPENDKEGVMPEQEQKPTHVGGGYRSSESGNGLESDELHRKASARRYCT